MEKPCFAADFIVNLPLFRVPLCHADDPTAFNLKPIVSLVIDIVFVVIDCIRNLRNRFSNLLSIVEFGFIRNEREINVIDMDV
jgi:hypothetical protein